MRYILSLLLFSILFNSPSQAYEKGQETEDGMIFLYKEPVEIYFNNWSGKSLSQSKIYISGEGKTVSFDGILQLNCESSSGYSWVTATNANEHISKEHQFNSIVPIQVISSAFERFCSKK